jgi:tellurite resistance protein TehA-like permease
MGTGGVAILIGGCPWEFRGQRALGTIFFFIDLVIFLINVAGVTSRAIYHPRTFKNSFYDHEDGIYVPCMALAFATLFVCKRPIQSSNTFLTKPPAGVLDYGVPYIGEWLVRVLQVVWFAYAAWGLVIAMVMEYTVRGSLRPLSAITPADCLLVFPLMLGGTTGSALAAVMPGSQATYIIVLSYMLQGMGWFLSLMK